jgi:hypothetical protein
MKRFGAVKTSKAMAAAAQLPVEFVLSDRREGSCQTTWNALILQMGLLGVDL